MHLHRPLQPLNREIAAKMVEIIDAAYVNRSSKNSVCNKISDNCLFLIVFWPKKGQFQERSFSNQLISRVFPIAISVGREWASSGEFNCLAGQQLIQ